MRGADSELVSEIAAGWGVVTVLLRHCQAAAAASKEGGRAAPSQCSSTWQARDELITRL